MRETDEGMRRDRTHDRVDLRETTSEGWHSVSLMQSFSSVFGCSPLFASTDVYLSSLGSPFVSRRGATYDLQFNTVLRAYEKRRVLQLVYTMRTQKRSSDGVTRWHERDVI